MKGSTSVLIMENGEPSFVVVNYENYKKLLSNEQEKEIEVNRPAAEIVLPSGSKSLDPLSQQDRRDSVSNGAAQRDGNFGIGAVNIGTGTLGTGTFQHKIGEKETELLDKINKEILALKSEIEKEEKGADASVD